MTIATISPVVRAALERGASVWYRARGHSMKPSILDGDRVLIGPLVGSPRLGDVVSFDTPGGAMNVHRVLSTRVRDGRPEVVVAGDNGTGGSKVVTVDRILGCVVALERQGRIRRLNTVMGRLSATVTAARQRLAVGETT